MIDVLNHILRRAERFATDSRGSLTVEALLVLPVLIWGALATLTFVDAFRHQTMNLRATYAIGDLLSRQTNVLDLDFFDGANEIYAYLTDNEDASLRISLFIWNAENEAYDFVWSHSTAAAHPDLTTATMGEVTPSIPQMSESKPAIVVETWVDYDPPFRVGIESRTFANQIITSPRFGPQLKCPQCS